MNLSVEGESSPCRDVFKAWNVELLHTLRLCGEVGARASLGRFSTEAVVIRDSLALRVIYSQLFFKQFFDINLALGRFFWHSTRFALLFNHQNTFLAAPSADYLAADRCQLRVHACPQRLLSLVWRIFAGSGPWQITNLCLSCQNWVIQMHNPTHHQMPTSTSPVDTG